LLLLLLSGIDVAICIAKFYYKVPAIRVKQRD